MVPCVDVGGAVVVVVVGAVGGLLMIESGEVSPVQVQNPSVTGPFTQLVTVLGQRPSGPQTPPVYGSQQGTIAIVVVA
jgi:hypothetical protein